MNRYFLALLVVALVLAAWGEISRVLARNALGKETANDATPTVVTVKPSRTDLGETLILPGTVQAFVEAPIYARTNGYLRIWYTDIGAPVKKGQLLGEIDTPEVDQERRQAVADMATAQANYDLAKITNERWQGLVATQSVSQQDADQRAGDAAAKAAALQSAAANLARLNELEAFKRVLAPFDGVVTQRNTDIGALINAGAGTSPGSSLFRVADTHRLRIYVYVPQPYSASIHPDVTASLEFADHPGRRYTATVANTAHALDAVSRTLQVELQIDNARGELLPGSYAQVYFDLPTALDTLRIPVNTVLFRTQNLQVATVGSDGRVHLKSFTEGRDFGTELEVLGGLSATDAIIVNPPDSITEGQQVRVVQPSASAPRSTPS